MLMCINDFTLFKNLNDEKCPIDGCNGSLVRIDDNIAKYVSELNHVLKKRGFPVRALFCSSPKLPTVFRGFVEFTTLKDEKIKRRTTNKNDIEDLQRIIQDNNADQNEFVYELIKDILEDNEINDLPLSKDPFDIGKLIIRDEELPLSRGFRWIINPLEVSFVDASIFSLSVLCTVSSSMFNLQLARLINTLHNL